MKNTFGLTIFACLLAGCETLMPVTSVGEPNEYVINRRDTSVFGSIAKVKASTRIEAENHCSSLSLRFSEKYSIDKARNGGQWPETTLLFRCY